MKIYIALGFMAQVVAVLCTDESTQFTDSGLRYEGGSIYRTGHLNDGRWDCQYHLVNAHCKDGWFFCTCPDGQSTNYRIPCKYKFPKCGTPSRRDHHCNRWTRCKTCLAGFYYTDKNTCKTCKPGYELNGGACDTDKNGCNKDNGNCTQKCFNTHGSYYCKCLDGFRLKSDKHSCQRMSCQAPGIISGGSVTPADKTQPWSYESYATFFCNFTTLTLDGPYATKCNAKGESLFWSENKPTCADTCKSVTVEERQQCGGEGISSVKCGQLGCCYQEHQDQAVPTCYFNPVKAFVRFGGQKPKTFTPHRSLRERSRVSCAHQTINKDGLNMYVMIDQGTGKNGIKLKVCQPLSGKVGDYELVASKGYDTYSTMQSAGLVIGKYEDLSELNIPSPHITGIPTAVFTQYPKLRSLRTPRLLFEVWQDVSTPLDNPWCVENCYSDCDSLTKVDVGHDGRDVTVYIMHLNLRDLNKYIHPNTSRVFLYAHTVVITEDVNLTTALYLHTTALIVDRSQASFINLPEGGAPIHELPSTGYVMDTIIRQCLQLDV